MRTSPTIQNVHLRMITNRAEVLFVSMRMMTLGRFRLCVGGLKVQDKWAELRMHVHV